MQIPLAILLVLVTADAASVVAADKTTQDLKNERLRLVSSWALVTLEPNNDDNAKLALPRLIGALTHEIPVARRDAANALGLLGKRAALAVPALVKSLAGDDPQMLSEVLHALGQIGVKSESALPQAVKLLEHPFPDVRHAAAFLLGKIGADAKAALPALRRQLKSRDIFERTIVAWALVKIDPKPEFIKIAVPLLIGALNRINPAARSEAARTLSEIGSADARVLPALKARAKIETDDETKKAIVEALQSLER